MTAPALERGLFSRMAAWVGDRLNPILLREVNQSLNGRGLVITGGLALLSVVLIALIVAAQGAGAAGEGMGVFAGTLLVLIPLLIFIVPVQAFISMRREVTRGTVDHLHLSRLGPGAIVRGKLAATMVQFILYFSIFAPLLGMTYLLRGVDVPSIALSLGIVFACGAGACSLAVACGALCRWRTVFRILPLIVVVVGLGGATITMMTTFGSSFFFRNSIGSTSGTEAWQYLVGVCGPVFVGVVFCALVGASALAHPYENRSTGFRVFVFVCIFVGCGYVLLMEALDRGGLVHLTTSAKKMLPGFAIAAGVLSSIFVVFAATEERGLSPRVKSRVPRHGILAALSLPFLPGGGRGILFGVVLTALVLGIASAGPKILAGAEADRENLGAAVITWMYVLVYAGAAGLFRGVLPRGTRWTWVARALVPLVVLASILLPVLIDAVTQGKMHHGRSAFDYLNPALIVDRYHERPGKVMEATAVLAVIWGILTILDMKRIAGAVSETLGASRERRERGAG